MSNVETQVVGGEEEDTSPPLVGQRPVEVGALAVTLALALLLAWDNWRTGIGWESTGPKPGYFPFYIAVILAGSCLFGLVKEIFFPKDAGETFVRRAAFKRVMQVLGPTILFVPAVQYLGLYVSSFLLIAGFMVFIGRIRTWVALLTAFIFSVSMFLTFELAFDVIMPKGPLEQMLGY